MRTVTQSDASGNHHDAPPPPSSPATQHQDRRPTIRAYTYPQHLSKYAVTRADYAAQNQITQLDAAVASVAVLAQVTPISKVQDPQEEQEQRVLLLQRCKEDTFPSCWELPGGSVEEQESILDAAARELKEETGLTLVSIERALDIIEFETGRQGHVKRWIKFTFVGTVAEGHKLDEIESRGIVLDRNEHDCWTWAGKRAVRLESDSGQGDPDWTLQFVNEASRLVILSAFGGSATASMSRGVNLGRE